MANRDELIQNTHRLLGMLEEDDSLITLLINEKNITGTINEQEYINTVSRRNSTIVSLIRIGYPYFVTEVALTEKQTRRYIVIRVNDKNYPLEATFLKGVIADDLLDHILKDDLKSLEFVGQPDKRKDKVVVPEEKVEDVNIYLDDEYYDMAAMEIGMVGSSHGCGTTYTALMLASLLQSKGKTAYVELNESNAMKSLLNNPKMAFGYFQMNNIDIYFGMSYKDFLLKYRDNYRYIVADFGVYEGEMDEDSDFAYFRQFALKFIVANSAKWGLNKIAMFEHYPEKIVTPKTIYLLPFAEEEIRRTVVRLTNKKAISIPYTREWFNPNPRLYQIFNMDEADEKKLTSGTDMPEVNMNTIQMEKPPQKKEQKKKGFFFK